MKDRILEFLRRENKSSAQFADEIGVQPSGISHILSGRNNPSLDFILKMLGRYSYLSTDWLLFGKGEMYRENSNATLFDLNEIDNNVDGIKVVAEPEKRPPDERQDPDNKHFRVSGSAPETHRTARIVIFYDNSTFREYYPEEG